jgi:phosphatidylserine decarboxylase
VVTEATSNWCFLILVIILQFFRNPKRIFTTNENQILAPVDGKVVVIEEVYEGEYYKDKRLQISIFMSPINVHVTRYAISGIVKFSKYHPGKFWSHGIRKLVKKTNELPSLKTIRLGILYRQVAGALARRIVNYAEEGMQLSKVLMLVSLNLVQELICFYLSELQSTLCLIKKQYGKHYCYKSIMIEKN